MLRTLPPLTLSLRSPSPRLPANSSGRLNLLFTVGTCRWFYSTARRKGGPTTPMRSACYVGP
eukprot:6214837-Pleurochrysis_carterae.AAC.4